MCLFCCDMLCWFSLITCCGCRDIVTRRLVFFPPEPYYDHIEPEEEFEDFYKRSTSKSHRNDSDDIKLEHEQSSDDTVRDLHIKTIKNNNNNNNNNNNKSNKSSQENEMEALNSSDDTTSDNPTIKRRNKKSIEMNRNNFGTFRIKDDDINLAEFYWNNYELKISNFKSQYLETKRGETIASYFIKHPESTYTILFSHGNAADIGLMRNHLCRMYQRCKVSIFAYEYSGYGRSSGKPSEKNTYSDIETAYKHLTRILHIKPSHIIAYGQSLGTCVSVYLASKYPVGGVILHSPLMSGLRVMQHFDKTYWFDIYPVVEQIQQVFAPIWVIHGNNDKEIDSIHGRILSRIAPNSYQPWFVDYAGHNDIEVMFPDILFKKIKKFKKYLINLEKTYINQEFSDIYHDEDDDEDDDDEDEDEKEDDIEEEEEEEEEEDDQTINEDTELARYKRMNPAHLTKSVTQKNTDESISPPPPQSIMTKSQDRIRQITLPSRKFSNTGNSMMMDDEESVLKTPSVAASMSISIKGDIDKSTNKNYDQVLTPTMRTIHSKEQSTSEILALPMSIKGDESRTMSTYPLNNKSKGVRKTRRGNIISSHPEINEHEEKHDDILSINTNIIKSSKRGKKRRGRNNKNKRNKNKHNDQLILPISTNMTDNINVCYQRRDHLLLETNDTSSYSSSSDDDLNDDLNDDHHDVDDQDDHHNNVENADNSSTDDIDSDNNHNKKKTITNTKNAER